MQWIQLSSCELLCCGTGQQDTTRVFLCSFCFLPCTPALGLETVYKNIMLVIQNCYNKCCQTGRKNIKDKLFRHATGKKDLENLTVCLWLGGKLTIFFYFLLLILVCYVSTIFTPTPDAKWMSSWHHINVILEWKTASVNEMMKAVNFIVNSTLL